VTALLPIQWKLGASGYRTLTVEKSENHPGVGNDRTGAQLPPHGTTCVAKLGLSDMSLPFCDLQFPHRAAPQQRPACTKTATYMYVVHFFQAN
jgi:hypothetical protein